MSSLQVTAVHRRRLFIRAPDATELPARISGRNLSVVCGDLVQCEYDARHDEWHVTAVDPRRNGLYRSNARGGSELIAANLTQLIVVLAAKPRPDFFMIDRYLCAAYCNGMRPLILVNKCDLALPAESDAELEVFGRAGVSTLRVSAHMGAGLDTLRQLLRAQTSILVGQSGVGKSSLLRALLPSCEAAVGELMRDEEGRHTTTVTRLHPLPGGGDILDSPGVRDFAPAIDQLTGHGLGFAELEQLAGQCRFGDCRHLREPNCAVQAAVAAGTISARRYESYRRLRRLIDRLGE
jgi:ribosome biogenesis GTPase / thiamine phosphate phosphatase